MKATTAQLVEELRHGTGDFLEQRRTASALTLLSMASLGLVALYQLGLIRNLPEPPLPQLNTDEVNGSTGAYALLEVPDSVLGLGSYAATLGLAAMGGARRARTQPWLPLALAGKALVDALQALRLTRRSWVRHRAFSIYSLVVLAATLATATQVLPEALAACKLRDPDRG